MKDLKKQTSGQVPSKPITADPPKKTDQSVTIFYLFVMAHLFLWVLLPVLTQPNAPLDTIEMLYWGHEWQLGYYKHPPLPAWLAELACQLLGRSEWPTYLTSQLCVVTCFWAAWQLGRDFLKPWPALCAALLLETNYYYNYTTPEFNNNVVSSAFWALSILFLYRAINSGRSLWWALTGASLALGTLSKYDTIILGGAMVGFSALHPVGKTFWKTSGPYIALATFMPLIAPHLYWMWANGFPTIEHILNRSQGTGQWTNHFFYPLRFLASQLAAVGPLILVAMPLVKNWKPRKVIQSKIRFERDFLLSIVFGPLVLILLVSLVTGIKLRSMWGSSLWTFTGVVTLFVFQLREGAQPVRKLMIFCMIATMLFATLLGAHNVVFPHFRDKASRVHFPGRQLAAEIQRRWNKQNSAPLTIVAGDWWPAGNVAFYAESRPSVFTEMDVHKSPWTNNEDLRLYGGVVLWEIGHYDNVFLTKLLKRFPAATLEAPISLNWQTKAKISPLQIGLIMIPPTHGTPRISNGLKDNNEKT